MKEEWDCVQLASFPSSHPVFHHLEYGIVGKACVMQHEANSFIAWLLAVLMINGSPALAVSDTSQCQEWFTVASKSVVIVLNLAGFQWGHLKGHLDVSCTAGAIFWSFWEFIMWLLYTYWLMWYYDIDNLLIYGICHTTLLRWNYVHPHTCTVIN